MLSSRPVPADVPADIVVADDSCKSCSTNTVRLFSRTLTCHVSNGSWWLWYPGFVYVVVFLVEVELPVGVKVAVGFQGP